MDTRVRPQDDFYRYVNGGWLEKNPIPKEESSWGSFRILRYKTEKQLRALVDDMLTMKRAAAGSPEQMVRDFYRSGLDMKARNQAGLTPLMPWLARIDAITDVASLVATIAHLEKIGGGGPWGLAVDQDMKNSERYILYVHQRGLGMPDRDYYVNDDAESKRVRAAYEKHIEALFVLAGATKAEAQKRRDVVMKIETVIA
jgi:putative endopeptidase